MNPSSRVRAITFTCEGDTLLGVLHEPCGEAKASGVGVLVVVGGPQYRVGSHRQFVSMARAMAAEGHTVLRADVRGMGDSTGDMQSFEHQQADVAAAVNTLLDQAPWVRQVVLWGLCDGASSALLYLHEHNDPRVTGLCLLNPWVRSEASLARTRVKHYYAQRLTQGDFWRKLFTGRVAAGALVELGAAVRRSFFGRARTAAKIASGTHAQCKSTLPYQARMAAAWQSAHRHLLLVLSSDDYTAKEFMEYLATDLHWKGAIQRPGVTTVTLPADHTFSASEARLSLEKAVLQWINETGGSPWNTPTLPLHRQARNVA